MFDTMFQITYFKIWKNIIVCFICVCDFFFKSNKMNAILFKEREKERKKKSKREGQSGGPIGKKKKEKKKF